MKTKKCEKCNGLIEKNKEKYKDSQIVCKKCFYKYKYSKRLPKNPNFLMKTVTMVDGVCK